MLGCCCHGITVNHSSPNSSHTLTLADPFSWNWQNVWEKREWGQRQGWCVGSTFYLNHFHWRDLTLFLGPSTVKLIKAGMWIMGCVLQIFPTNRLKMHSSVVKQLSRSTDEECYTMCALCRSAVLWIYIYNISKRGAVEYFTALFVHSWVGLISSIG